MTDTTGNPLGVGVTPGPWFYDKAECRITSQALTNWEKRPTSVVDLLGVMGGDDSDADARLIAAAPSLYEALEGLVEGMPEGCEYELVQGGLTPNEARKLTAARQALSLARGEE